MTFPTSYLSCDERENLGLGSQRRGKRTASRGRRPTPAGGTRSTESAPAKPELKETLKRLFMKIHPDLFHREEEIRRTNDASFQALQEFLQGIRAIDLSEGYPPPRTQRLDFFLRDAAANNGYRRVALVLRTTGGDCRSVVQRSLCSFFAECGLSAEFEVRPLSIFHVHFHLIERLVCSARLSTLLLYCSGEPATGQLSATASRGKSRTRRHTGRQLTPKIRLAVREPPPP